MVKGSIIVREDNGLSMQESRPIPTQLVENVQTPLVPVLTANLPYLCTVLIIIQSKIGSCCVLVAVDCQNFNQAQTF